MSLPCSFLCTHVFPLFQSLEADTCCTHVHDVPNKQHKRSCHVLLCPLEKMPAHLLFLSLCHSGCAGYVEGWGFGRSIPWKGSDVCAGEMGSLSMNVNVHPVGSGCELVYVGRIFWICPSCGQWLGITSRCQTWDMVWCSMVWHCDWHGMAWRLAWDGMVVDMGWWLQIFRIAEGVAWQTPWCSHLAVYGIGFSVGKVMWQWQWQWRQCGILVDRGKG